jgi:alkaline phosphatase D
VHAHLAVLSVLLFGFLGAIAPDKNAEAAGFEAAFGSCLRQWRPQPIWDGILSTDPDLFIFLGDNVYTDKGPYRRRAEPRRIVEAYKELGENPGFQRLRTQVPLLATWDDHDYGANNAGLEYPFKLAAKAAFMDFFDVPPDSPLHHRSGIYHAKMLDTPAGRVQVMLLDTRSFRSPLVYGDTDAACPRSKILPNDDPQATVLGEAQWSWLVERLAEPADLRILVSSIQVIPDAHCYEKWANFPRERQRLFDAIRGASGGQVILLSGDRHLGEISRIEIPASAAVYEVTASGLNSAGAGKDETNLFRVHNDNVRVDHFGLLRVERDTAGMRVVLELRGVDGEVIQSAAIPPTMEVRSGFTKGH